MAAPVYRTIGGEPIIWTDPQGITHACEAADAVPGGGRLVWTVCDRDGAPVPPAISPRDVPPDRARTAGPGDRIDCPKCLAIGRLKPPAAS